MKRRMWSLAFGLVCAGMTLSVQGHAGWAPQKPQAVTSMSALDLPAFKKPITKRFVNAKLSEVLAWLSLEKFSFVADVSEFPEQGQVTLNFQSQPLGAVLDAIADAYKGRWERRGDIFTLRSSANRFYGTTSLTAPPTLEGTARTLGPVAGARAPMTTTTPALIPAPGARVSAGAVASPPLGGTATTAESARGLLPLTRAVGAQGLAAPATTVRNFGPGLVLPPGERSVRGTVSVPRTLLAPTIATPRALEGIRSLSTPVTVFGTQDTKSQEEAMKQAERALREAEEALRKMHESGEWKREMEKAMSEARGEHAQEMRKAMEEMRRAMQNMPNSKEWKETWAKAREEIRQALKSGKVTENGKTRKMTDKERKKLEETLKKFEKTPEFKFDFKDMPKFDEKVFAMPKMDFEKMKLDEKTFVMPKIDSKMFERIKEMPDVKVWANPEDKSALEKLMKDHKTFVMPKIDGKTWVMPDMDKKAWEKMMKEHKTFVMPKIEGKDWIFMSPEGGADREAKIRQRIQEMRRRSGVKGGDDTFHFDLPKIPRADTIRPLMLDSKKMRIKELLDSLTNEQKEKQERNGYLTVEDLTPKQRAMLGDVSGDGNWTITYSVDGKKVTIKNK